MIVLHFGSAVIAGLIFLGMLVMAARDPHRAAIALRVL
ncbi:hypothetical protein J2858_000990 [Neorhizobium galegae]|nr:hypothetical protein [Neorhizobium galegae]